MPASLTMPVRHATILVVEDAPVNQRILRGLLEREGYRVLVAGNGRMALDLVQGDIPDLVLLDILMPEVDGLETCRLLKEMEPTRDIPVIFISSLDETADKLKGFEAGGVDYITKPFHPAEVLARVATHLNIRCLQFQLKEKNRLLEEERRKSEALLLNVLPARVARELMDHGQCTPQCFAEVTVGFIDIVAFTASASRLTPEYLIDELNALFTAFDHIAETHRCERMKTIGDAYLFVCGLSEPNQRHAQAMAAAALDSIAWLEARNQVAEQRWQVRIGLHAGPVIGGIVGVNKYLYDIFGDTVNTASRLEQLARPMHICISQAVRDRLADEFVLAGPERVEMRGKGPQDIYVLQGRKRE